MSANDLHNSFEGEKNRKAALYTGLICVFIVMFSIIYTWPLKAPASPNMEDLIEINLGNEEEGWGEVQPLVPGDPAPDNQSIAANISSNQVREESPTQSMVADETVDEEAAPVVQAPKKAEKKPVENKEVANKSSKSVNPSPVPNPNPAPPKPKVPLYKGGTGEGGNRASEDNGYRNQGYKPGGTGDAGSPDGKADSYGNSPGGRSGVSVVRGLSGRRPISFPSMQDDFNENAIVFVDIKVDASGRVTSANIARGTTTSNPTLRNIALQKARQLKFPAADSEVESGTIRFNFVLKS